MITVARNTKSAVSASINTEFAKSVAMEFVDFKTERVVKLLITPDMAKKLMGRNAHNRPANRAQIRTLVTQIERRRWKVTGETIIFGWDGRLLNGQHRLTACIEADLPIETFVAFGIDPECFPAIDRTKRRSTSDDLAIKNEKHTGTLSAVCGLVYSHESGMNNPLVGRNVASEDVSQTLEIYPEIRDSVDYAAHTGKRLPVPPRLVGFCHFRFTQKDPVLANHFFEGWVDGAFLDPQDPVYLLREKLIKQNSHRSKLSETVVLGLIIKAWNLSRKGDRRQSLSFQYGGNHAEAFPIIA